MPGRLALGGFRLGSRYASRNRCNVHTEIGNDSQFVLLLQGVPIGKCSLTANLQFSMQTASRHRTTSRSADAQLSARHAKQTCSQRLPTLHELCPASNLINNRSQATSRMGLNSVTGQAPAVEQCLPCPI
mmetsp:Transcript_1448/g.2590  ORF Transcript_1448/g.2590 Transcript_1448/m.2590 type:complete len:130 (+) Transcript_1448:204-593(+)